MGDFAKHCFKRGGSSNFLLQMNLSALVVEEKNYLLDAAKVITHYPDFVELVNLVRWPKLTFD